ncbi:MAG: M20/M25/M40 family metallo-hydrolase [Verrucomicrobiota bacterium]
MTETALLKPASSDLEAAKALLQRLIQIKTVNPSGNEGEIAEVLAWELQSEGITAERVGADPDRPNLIAKIEASPENRRNRPLVLSCHVDTVPVENESDWAHPPFSGVEADGCIWGRGAIDMKGFAVMALTAYRLIRRSRLPLNRDVIFAAVADEEAGTRLGSEWLVNERPDLLGSDPEYVINEVGGFTMHRKEHRFYPIQVAEKGVAWLRMTVKGTPGHSSLPMQGDNAIVSLAEAVAKISRAQLPWHPSPPAATMIESFSQFESATIQKMIRGLTKPVTGPQMLKFVPKEQRATLEAVLRNTANPTKLQGSSVINSIPARAFAEIDGRLAPGQTADDLTAELRKVVGDPQGVNYDFDVLHYSPAVEFSTDTSLYRKMCGAIQSADPGGIPVPTMIGGFTDSKNYGKLGAQCYGFYPLKLPADIDFAALFHGTDERIPVDGFYWGIDTLSQMLGEFLVE